MTLEATGATVEADVCTLDDLRAVLPKGVGSGDEKVLTELDAHCRRFIAASPFIVVASRNADGQMDVSPKGDPPGFVRVLDNRTIAIPERPGNRRCDTFTNVLEADDVAVLFLVPGVDMTLRVMGKASLTTDEELCESMAMQGRSPALAMLVRVTEAFVHCGKAPKRAGLWTGANLVDPKTFPTMGQMMHDQISAKVPNLPLTRQDMVEMVDDDYKNNVY